MRLNRILSKLETFGFTVAASAALALTHSSSVVDGGGTISSNANFQNLSAIGQGSPVGYNASTAIQNYTGFLNAFILHPELDADRDSIVDENDPDDDNDTLLDTAELVGIGFSPSISTDPFSADTDGDGVGDGSESLAGTNPRDPNSLLKIVRLELSDGFGEVEWKSRGGTQYEVLHAETLEKLTLAPAILGPFMATGGIGAWFETTSANTNLTSGPNSFYSIRVMGIAP